MVKFWSQKNLAFLDPNKTGKTQKRSRSIINWGNNVFVGVMHTSDVIGDPESRIGNVDVYTNGGRLQPGCYNNENNITECKIDLLLYPLHWYFLGVHR